MEPLRHIIRHKKRAVKYYEAEATKIDVDRRVVKINDFSDVKGNVSETEVPFDYLVVGVGAENATFGEFFLIFIVDYHLVPFWLLPIGWEVCIHVKKNMHDKLIIFIGK